jgi:hypothetical protein
MLGCFTSLVTGEEELALSVLSAASPQANQKNEQKSITNKQYINLFMIFPP